MDSEAGKCPEKSEKLLVRIFGAHKFVGDAVGPNCANTPTSDPNLVEWRSGSVVGLDQRR